MASSKLNRLRYVPLFTAEAKAAGIPNPSTLAVLRHMARQPQRSYSNVQLGKALKLHSTTIGAATVWLANNGYAEEVGTTHWSKTFKLTEDGIELDKMIPGPEVEIEEDDIQAPAPNSELAELRAMVESLNGKVAQLGMMPSSQAGETTMGLQTVEEATTEVIQILDWIAGQEDVSFFDRIHAIGEVMTAANEQQKAVLIAQMRAPFDVNPAPILRPVPDPPKPQPNGKPCSNCGISDHECWHQGVNGRTGLPCCGRCGHTATHGQDEPGYIPPYPLAYRGGSGGRAS